MVTTVMQIFEPTIYHIVYWSGQITSNRLRLDSFSNDIHVEPHEYHSAMAPNQKWNRIFCCTTDGNYTVSEYLSVINADCGKWEFVRHLPCYKSYEKELLLQLKLDRSDRWLLGTAGKGFIVWDLGDDGGPCDVVVYLALPHGVRNISTKLMSSNSMMISSKYDYAVAGVRLVRSCSFNYLWRLSSLFLLEHENF